MNGIDGFDAPVQIQIGILDLQHRRYQTRLPVVAVNDVGHIVQQRQCAQHCAAEEGVTLALVCAGAVDIIAAEILLVIYEVEGHALIFQLMHACILAAPAEIDVEIEQVAHLLAPLFIDHLI